MLAEGPLAVGEAVELGLGGGEGGLLLGDGGSQAARLLGRCVDGLGLGQQPLGLVVGVGGLVVGGLGGLDAGLALGSWAPTRPPLTRGTGSSPLAMRC